MIGREFPSENGSSASMREKSFFVKGGDLRGEEVEEVYFCACSDS